MDRREFLAKSGIAAAGVGLVGGAGSAAAARGPKPSLADLPDLEWEMPTSWPLNLDTIFGAAEVFAEEVGRLTGGKFVITARAGGEVVPGLEVLQNVQSGAYPIGHTASYYYIGLAAWTAFGTALPFGLNYRQQNSWLYEGGGLTLLQELYDQTFGVIQFPAGNTGCQMGGWFRDEITSVDDLAGLKMRIAGLGGQVMAELGVAVQVIAGGEIYQALQTGAIDAAEWVGPYDDLNLGFAEIAQNYYYPGWWEAGPTLEVQINKAEWDGLPEHYQNAIQAAAFKANTIMMARYDKQNAESLAPLEEAGVTIRPYPDDIMNAAREATTGLFEQLSSDDENFARVFESWDAFRRSQAPWWGMAEASIINFATAEAGGGGGAAPPTTGA
jgi:TRAP-type mannitol/chloroaromatic compound transport system substrate-binding protein